MMFGYLVEILMENGKPIQGISVKSLYQHSGRKSSMVHLCAIDSSISYE